MLGGVDMTTALIAIAVWFLVAMFVGWVLAQCINAMAEPDPLEQVEAETEKPSYHL